MDIKLQDELDWLLEQIKELQSHADAQPVPKEEGQQTECGLCDMGHPIDDKGYHIPTQSKGMIPRTKCQRSKGRVTLNGGLADGMC